MGRPSEDQPPPTSQAQPKPGQELERVATISSLAEKVEYAERLAASSLLPASYRGKPANVLVAVEYGASLELPPMTAIQGVHVIEGKPSLSADLMAALIRRAGHKLRVGFKRDREDPAKSYAFAEIVRSDDPDFTYRCEWDWARAQRVKDIKTGKPLTSKPNWQNYPEAMLKARCITEVAREGASEVLHGMIYSPDELGFTTDRYGHPVIEGEVVSDSRDTAQPTAQPTGQEPAQEPAQEATDATETAAQEKRPEKDPPATKRDLAGLHATFSDYGLKGTKDEVRQARMDFVMGVVMRPVESTNDLTQWEVEKVKRALRADIHARKEAERISADQMGRIEELFEEHGLTDNMAQFAKVRVIIGKPVMLLNNLTADEAAQVIEAMEPLVLPDDQDDPNVVDAELVEDEDPRLNDGANDGALDAQMETEKEGTPDHE